MQKAFFRKPAPFFDEFLVHDGDLPCRSAKADQAELQPEPEGIDE
ncbi:hypothetical protein AEAC466_11545 [Asticcacaulis sp. AC466]|nr:hypothetical protein AEAC466_11545 [Asticcacaulis sp. AC466]